MIQTDQGYTPNSHKAQNLELNQKIDTLNKMISGLTDVLIDDDGKLIELVDKDELKRFVDTATTLRRLGIELRYEDKQLLSSIRSSAERISSTLQKLNDSNYEALRQGEKKLAEAKKMRKKGIFWCILASLFAILGFWLSGKAAYDVVEQRLIVRDKDKEIENMFPAADYGQYIFNTFGEGKMFRDWQKFRKDKGDSYKRVNEPNK